MDLPKPTNGGSWACRHFRRAASQPIRYNRATTPRGWPMHVLFVHQNYPAQFGHLAAYLVRHYGDRCTFLSQKATGDVDGVRRIAYQLKGGATERSHYCSRTFENAIWHTYAVTEAL